MIMLVTKESHIKEVYLTSKYDATKKFSVKVKGQTKKGRQTEKRTGISREKSNNFTEFSERFEVAHK